MMAEGSRVSSKNRENLHKKLCRWILKQKNMKTSTFVEYSSAQFNNILRKGSECNVFAGFFLALGQYENGKVNGLFS